MRPLLAADAIDVNSGGSGTTPSEKSGYEAAVKLFSKESDAKRNSRDHTKRVPRQH